MLLCNNYQTLTLNRTGKLGYPARNRSDILPIMRQVLSALALLCAMLTALPARAEVVNVYTSANFAPLLIGGGGQGLYPDLIDYLNRQQLGDLSFRLNYLPRKRLQMQLENGKLDGIVIGMMPAWLNDEAQRKYLWTTPFAIDRFVLVSRREQPANPAVAGALYGKTIGLTLGYVYPGIDEWIRREGLHRADALSEEINLEKLRLDRIDCVAVSESVARYYLKSHNAENRFTLFNLPGRQTERRFLVPQGQAEVYERLAPVIRKLKDDPAWLRILSKYE